MLKSAPARRRKGDCDGQISRALPRSWSVFHLVTSLCLSFQVCGMGITVTAPSKGRGEQRVPSAWKHMTCACCSLRIPASSPSVCDVPLLSAPAKSAREPGMGKRCHSPLSTWKGGPDEPQSRGGKFSCPASNSGSLTISFTVFNSHANFVTRIYTWSLRQRVQ